MTTAPHLVLSMDTGIDDALALAYLVAAGARIDGVSATYGNVLQQQAERNTRMLLDMLGRPAIPVAAGIRHGRSISWPTPVVRASTATTDWAICRRREPKVQPNPLRRPQRPAAWRPPPAVASSN